MALITKLQSLSIHEPSYLVLYSQCQKCFLEIAQNLPKPQLLPASTSQATISYQSNHTAAPSPQAQASPQHHSPVSAPVHTSAPTASDSASDFFRTQPRGCAFCGHPIHRIRQCPAAEEYVNTGRVKIFGGRLYLPTGQPIPNDGRGLGMLGLPRSGSVRFSTTFC